MEVRALGQRVALHAFEFFGSRQHLRSGVVRSRLLSFGWWRRLSLPPPEPAQSSSLDGDGPKPSSASRLSARSRGPSSLLPSPGAVLGVRRVLGGVRGHRVGAGVGRERPASGGRSGPGRRGRLRAGSRLEGSLPCSARAGRATV